MRHLGGPKAPLYKAPGRHEDRYFMLWESGLGDLLRRGRDLKID